MKSLKYLFIAVILCGGFSCTPVALSEDASPTVLTGDEDSIRPDNDRR